MASRVVNGQFAWSKWHLALAVGAVGIGIGYWYMRQPQQRGKLEQSKKSLSIDDGPEVPTNESPLQLAERYKNEGNLHFRKGKYDEAIASYQKAIETCPENQSLELATYYQNRAAAYEQLKKWSAVITDCSKALEYNNRYEKALFRRAKAYESLKDYENCLDDITAVCLLQGFQNHNAMLMADRVLKDLGKVHAAEAFKNKTPKLPSNQFIKTYFMTFSEDPVYKKLMDTEVPIGEGEVTGFLRAKLAFATDNFDEIIPACMEEIFTSESESQYKVEALALRGSFYFLSGMHKEAMDDFRAIIENPDAHVKIRVNCLIKRASLHMQVEDVTKCMADMMEAAALGPNISDIYHHRGQVNLLMEKYEDARSDFKKAVTLNPDFSIAVVQKCYADYRYALMTQDMALLMENMQAFRKATVRFPNCAEAFVLYAQVLTERQEYEEADKLYLKAIEIEPQNATILVHRGLLYLQWKGEIEKAVGFMQKAIKLDPKCEFAYETIGTVEVQRGNLLVAMELFDKSIDLARTEMELTHLFSLKDAAISQLKITTKLGIGPALLRTED